MGYGGWPNSGPHAFVTSALYAELSPQALSPKFLSFMNTARHIPDWRRGQCCVLCPGPLWNQVALSTDEAIFMSDPP